MESGCGIAVAVGIGVAVKVAVGNIVGDGDTRLVGVGREVGTAWVVHAPINNKKTNVNNPFQRSFFKFIEKFTNKVAVTLPRKTIGFYRFLPVRNCEEANSNCYSRFYPTRPHIHFHLGQQSGSDCHLEKKI